jgi:hypothetical protein
VRAARANPSHEAEHRGRRVERKGLPDWPGRGCRVNAVSLEAVIEHYKAAGLVDQVEPERLAPHMSAFEETWERTLSAGDQLRRLFTVEPTDGGRGWGSVDSWRSANGTWTFQNMVADGHVGYDKACALMAIAMCWADLDFVAIEAPSSNAVLNRVLEGSAHALGDHLSARASYEYVAMVPPDAGASRVRLREIMGPSSELLDLVRRSRGPVPVVAAGLTTDPGLEQLDALYRSVGLRRYRRIWLAQSRSGKSLGAALAHRGPLGLNFSLLENRCDLVLDVTLPVEEATEVAVVLLAAAADAYADFVPGFLPVVTPRIQVGPAIALGGSAVESFGQNNWLRPGLPRLAEWLGGDIRNDPALLAVPA